MNRQFTNQRKSFVFEYRLCNGQRGFFSALAFTKEEAADWVVGQLFDIFGPNVVELSQI